MLEIFLALVLVGIAPIVGIATACFFVGAIWYLFDIAQYQRLQEFAIGVILAPLAVLITGLLWIGAYRLIVD